MKKIILILLTAVAAGIACHLLGVKYAYTDLKDYSSVLLAISGMVFTIMGIWVAFVYPNAIVKLKAPQKIETADFSEAQRDTSRLEAIVGSIMESGAVATGVAIIHLSKLIFSETNVYLEHSSIIQATGIGFILFLTLLQGSAIVNVIYSNYSFINELHKRREKREEDSDF